MRLPDHDLTEIIPRLPSDTGPLPVISPPGPRQGGGWRAAAAAALILAWVTMAMWAYALARIAVLLLEWR